MRVDTGQKEPLGVLQGATQVLDGPALSVALPEVSEESACSKKP